MKPTSESAMERYGKTRNCTSHIATKISLIAVQYFHFQKEVYCAITPGNFSTMIFYLNNKKAAMHYISLALALICAIYHQSPFVSAQFATCLPETDTASGNTYILCLWAQSPLVLAAGQNTAYTSDNSRVYSFCKNAGLFSVEECSCAIYIYDDAYDFSYTEANYCNSCTLVSITYDSFSIFWDCSNRLAGNCPVLTSDGCQTTTPKSQGTSSSATSGGMMMMMMMMTTMASTLLLLFGVVITMNLYE